MFALAAIAAILGGMQASAGLFDSREVTYSPTPDPTPQPTGFPTTAAPTAP